MLETERTEEEAEEILKSYLGWWWMERTRDRKGVMGL